MSEEEKKHASFRAPKESLDLMWRGSSAIHGQACHVNSLMGQRSGVMRQYKDMQSTEARELVLKPFGVTILCSAGGRGEHAICGTARIAADLVGLLALWAC